MSEQMDKILLGPEAASRFKKVRYAYVVLALISVVCAFIAVEIALAAIRNNNQNFCDLVATFKHPAPVKPTDPAKDPRGERTWIVYGKVVRLDRRLGCDKLYLLERRGMELNVE